MSGSDKMHLIHDEWGRARNIDIASETEPTETWPYMLWLKVSTATLKVRNLTNSAWVTVGTGGGGGAPIDAQYLLMAPNAELTHERILAVGKGLDLADGGAGGTATLTVDADDLDGDGLQESGGDLAVDATVVRISGAQTIAGEKTLTDAMVIKLDSTTALIITDSGDTIRAFVVDTTQDRIVVSNIHSRAYEGVTHIALGNDLDLRANRYIYFRVGGNLAVKIVSASLVELMNGKIAVTDAAVKGLASTLPDLGSITAAEKWGNIYLGTDKALNVEGKLIIEDDVIKGQGSTFPNLGTTTLAEKLGHIYLGTAKDVSPMDDGGGLFQRGVDHWRTITDHFNTFAGYTWANYAPFDGAPSVVDVAGYPSLLRLVNDDITEDHFCYVTCSATGSLVARLTKGVNSYVGIRMQNNDNDNDDYVEFKLVDGTATGLYRLQMDVRVGGGAVTTVYSVDALPMAFYLLRIAKIATNVYCYYTMDTPLTLYVSGAAAGWTAARAGIVFGQRTSASSYDRAGIVDWIEIP